MTELNNRQRNFHSQGHRPIDDVIKVDGAELAREHHRGLERAEEAAKRG